jgi:hypothetical protein
MAHIASRPSRAVPVAWRRAGIKWEFRRTELEPIMSKKRSKPDPSQESSGARAAANPLGHGAKTDTVRERAILALLAEKTIKAAARRIALDERRCAGGSTRTSTSRPS